MTESEIRDIFEQWVDAWNSYDVDRLKSFYADEAVLYQAPTEKTLVGRHYVINRFKSLKDMSSDGKMTIRELHIDGNSAILEFNVKGTHTGRFLDYEPTGKKMDIDSCLSFKVMDGKIINHTSYLDTATILRAIGLLDIPGTREEAA